jgi:hypothetical protein
MTGNTSKVPQGGYFYPDQMGENNLKEMLKEFHENFDPHPEYQQLPEGIKASITPKEYAWLNDEARRNLQSDMTTPEVGED